MNISPSLDTYLKQHQIQYYLLTHPRTETAAAAARLAKIPIECMVKGVLLEDEEGYLMVAVPSNMSVDLSKVHLKTGRQLKLVREAKLAEILADCEYGAVPALGEAYGIPTLWDDQLAYEPELYFEAGNHREVVHLEHDEFIGLMAEDRRSMIAH